MNEVNRREGDIRLDRIEGKLDKLSEAVVSLARMEERMIQLFKRMDTYDREASILRADIQKLNEISAGRGQTMRLLERIWWIAFTAAIGAIFYYIKGA